ncbi:MAG: pyruvate dehydrogenase (acetyl-transferring) E1 component subunit alpha, partial [Gemmatimonadetes bacterium]|nr:pyruvate dehydrogenase (acetyl-transferring) E1 component subunit alpha [Gemmatimonadota bacterium]
MRAVTQRFEISHRRVLNPDGSTAEGDDSSLGVSQEELRDRLIAMSRTRLFDARAVELQRAGQLGTYA